MKLFYITKLFLVLLIRNSQSFLCILTGSGVLILCLLTYLSIYFPAEWQTPYGQSLGCIHLSIPENTQYPFLAAGRGRGSVNTYSVVSIQSQLPS